MAIPERFRIYQAELTSQCNLKCSYCPHPTMSRAKGHMSEAVLAACIAHVKRTGGRRLVLHHFGEPLLHPELLHRLQMVAAAGLEIQFSTNGVLLKQHWNSLRALGSKITVMLAFHKWVKQPPQTYAREVRRLQAKARGTSLTVVPAFAFKQDVFVLHRWADGAFKQWSVSECPFIKDNLAVVLWNGDIGTCCVDHEGATVRHNILDADADKHISRAWAACATCDVGRLMQGETL